ncbi:MAG: hypothetical protein AB1567_06920 [bacterium]
MVITKYKTNISRQVFIKPKGFSGDAILVYQKHKRGVPCQLTDIVFWDFWRGVDGTLTQSESIRSLIKGLQKALKIAEKWDKEINQKGDRNDDKEKR